MKTDNERMRKDIQDDIKILSTNWDKRLKFLEEEYRNIKNSKEELEKNQSHTRKELTEYKLNKEIEDNARESRIIAEEVI